MGMTLVRFLAMWIRSRPDHGENSTAKMTPSNPTELWTTFPRAGRLLLNFTLRGPTWALTIKLRVMPLGLILLLSRYVVIPAVNPVSTSPADASPRPCPRRRDVTRYCWCWRRRGDTLRQSVSMWGVVLVVVHPCHHRTRVGLFRTCSGKHGYESKCIQNPQQQEGRSPCQALMDHDHVTCALSDRHHWRSAIGRTRYLSFAASSLLCSSVSSSGREPGRNSGRSVNLLVHHPWSRRPAMMGFHAWHLLHDDIFNTDRIGSSISAPCEYSWCTYAKNFSHELQGSDLTCRGEERDTSKGSWNACYIGG